MDDQRRSSGCLGSAIGLLGVLALVLVLFGALLLLRPEVREFATGVGVPVDKLLPRAFVGFVPEPEDVPSLDDVREDGMAYSALSDERKLVYAQLLAGVESLEPSIAVHQATKDDIEPAFHAMLVDHPELFWLNGSTNYTYFENGGTITVTPGLNMELDQVPEVRSQIEAAADAFVASLPQDASTYVVALAAYERVIDITDYNMSAENNQNIQSVFLGHASVCAGYARAYQYLLQRAGVFCSFVEGRIPSTGEDHAWNIVRMGDEYTFVDPTWGDPTYPGLQTTSPGISYDYLGLTTDEVKRDDHVFDNEEMWPICESPAFGYYANNGLLFDVYDGDALSTAFWQQWDVGSTTIAFKFSNDEAYVQARDALAAGEFLPSTLQQAFAASDREDYSYQYQASDSLRIVKLFL